MEWDHISRTLHWRQSMEDLERLSPTKKNVQIKQIIANGYFQDGGKRQHLLTARKVAEEEKIKEEISKAGSKTQRHEGAAPASGQKLTQYRNQQSPVL